MSEKEQYVEVTIRVPKKLMELLEAEDYLGWKREDFFEAAIRGHIGITVDNFPWEEAEAFFRKYGKNIHSYSLKSTRVVDC